MGYENFDEISKIAIELKKAIISSNQNRMNILYLLLNSPNYELQTEKIANILGISHRTALYHLDLLQEYDIVEVRRYRKRGNKLMRSIWGLNMKNWAEIECIIDKIKSKIPEETALAFKRKISE